MSAPLPPLEGAARIIVTIALAGAVLMQALDSSIANVAIPAISGDLGVSPTQGTWVITSFTVATAIAVPLTGWLARRFGEVRLFCIAVALFTLASWGCGLAENVGMLIFFRVLQGAFAGPLIPLSQTLLMSVYPPDKKGMALAVWSMMALVGPVAGPILGGWITDNYSWPWIFFINIPLGALCVWLSWQRLHKRESAIVKQPIDSIGLALMVVAVGSLQLMLDRGRELDWFESTEIVILALVAAITLVATVIWELNEKHPIVDLHFFSNRNFTLGTLVASAAFGLYFASVVILPLWLQTQLGYTAGWAGWATAPTSVLSILIMPIVGRYLYRVDVRYFVTFACLVFAFCFFWRASFNTNVTFWQLVGPQFLQGAATACMFVPLTAVVFTGLSPDRIASAAGLTNFVRMLASGFAASLSTTLWDRRAAVHHATLVEHANPYDANFLDHLSAFGGDVAGTYARIEQVISVQSYMLSTVELFWLFGWIFLALIPVVWITRPRVAPQGAAPPPPVVD